MSRYTSQNLIPMFFSVQKIHIPSLEMVCNRTVLALWKNDKRSAPWTLPVEYGYYWCSRSYSVFIIFLDYSLSFFIRYNGMLQLYISIFFFSKSCFLVLNPKLDFYAIGWSRAYFCYCHLLQETGDHWSRCWVQDFKQEGMKDFPCPDNFIFELCNSSLMLKCLIRF